MLEALDVVEEDNVPGEVYREVGVIRPARETGGRVAPFFLPLEKIEREGQSVSPPAFCAPRAAMISTGPHPLSSAAGP